jgi:hypothetical protein
MVIDMDPLAELQRTLTEKNALIATLEAELARLRPPPPPVPTIDGAFQVPSTAEVARLIDIVISKYPKLKPRGTDHERFLRSVRHCMAFIGTCNRLPPGQTDSKFRERWCDRCREWVTREGYAADVSPLTFCIAIIASGDVDFIDPDSIGNGGVLNFGLTDGVGRKPRNGWLLVLQNGKPREALAPPMHQDWKPMRRIMPEGNERFLPGRIETI